MRRLAKITAHLTTERTDSPSSSEVQNVDENRRPHNGTRIRRRPPVQSFYKSPAYCAHLAEQCFKYNSRHMGPGELRLYQLL